MTQDRRSAPVLRASLPTWIMSIVQTFVRHNFQCYLVGGAVRDLLRGQTASDYDLATDATPREMQRLWRRTVPTGVKYGTVTLLSENNSAEMTTFRSDDEYADGRHPERVRFGRDLRTDLSRRDFTVNAIAYDPSADRLIDPFGGGADIRRLIIRTVGDPAQRLAEDALRVLRAIRFATTLDFTIEPQTERALRACAPGVRAVSAERIREELERIIASPRCRSGFEILARMRLLPIIFSIPPLAAGLQERDGTLHPLIARRLETAASIVMAARDAAAPETAAQGAASPAPETKTAARDAAPAPPPARLLHALLWHALLQQWAQNDHARAEQILAQIGQQLSALRYSRAHQDGVIHLVRMLAELPLTDCTAGEIRYFFSRVGRNYMAELRRLITALHTNDELAQTIDAERLLAIASTQQVFAPRDLAINGDDLQRIGYAPGRQIGAFLAHALRHVSAHPEENTRHHLTVAARAFLHTASDG